MNELYNNIKHITSPTFNAGFGNGVEEAIENINHNFTTIAHTNYEFLRGARGNSTFLKTISVNDNEEILNLLKTAISEQFGGIAPQLINNIDVMDWFNRPQKITLIYEKRGSEEYLISSLPFIFKDLRFEQIGKAIDLDNETDWSCVLYWVEADNKFIAAQEFPTLYYENGFKWKINGVKTGLDAQGPKGDTGEGSLHVVYVELDGSSYRITDILDPLTATTVNIINGSETPKKICENYGIVGKTGSNEASVVVAILPGDPNESYIAPVYTLQDEVYVYCTENNMICEVTPILSSEIEILCKSVWGDIWYENLNK